MKTGDDGRYELHLCHCESCNRVRKDINLDSFKSGMTKAATIAAAIGPCSGTKDWNDSRNLAMKQAQESIITARDDLKELP